MSSSKLWIILRGAIAVLVIFAWVFSPWGNLTSYYTSVYFSKPVAEKIAKTTPKTQIASADIIDGGGDTWVIITVASNSALSNTWTVPYDWNSASNSVQIIGGGGAGGDGSNSEGAGGGGGGGYSKRTGFSLTPGNTVSFSAGAGGTAAAADSRGGNGGHSYFNVGSFANCTGVSTCVSAEGGEGGKPILVYTGGLGGGTTSASGTTKYLGGTGGVGSVNDGSGGGGGAGGPLIATDGDGQAGGAGSANEGGGGGGAGGASATDGSPSDTPTNNAGGGGGTGYAGGAGGAGGNGTGSNAHGASGVNVGSGGGGGDVNGNGGNGANGGQWLNLFGSGGGGGGNGDSNSTTGGTGGLYGGGGGGSADTGGTGGDGIIVVKYRPITEITPTAVGTQTASINIPGSATSIYIGGAFRFTTTSTTTVTSIAVTASTSTDAVTGLDDVKLYWDTAASCDTTNPITNSTLYNTASANFSTLKATISGSTAVTAGTPKCFYPAMDVGSTVTDGLRFDIKIQVSTDIETAITEVGTYPVEINGVTVFNAAAETITLTLDAGGVVAFGTLTNGTRVTATTRLKVEQTNASSLTITAGHLRSITNVTLASGAAPLITSNQISDTAGGIDVFDGLGANCTDGTGPTTWGTGVSTGLGFTLWADSNTSRETACWGTGTTVTDALNKYAALQASASASSFINISSSPPSTLYTSIGYSLDVGSTQKATEYDGGVVFTATVSP